MSGATRGTVLSGRYRLDERIHSNPDGALWRALDSTLDRKVSIRVMRPGHPFAADVADAARRAALIDDPRLVRVLDVGSDDDVGFVVSEFVDGDSLGTLVERSPLSPPAVRRIVGEVAQGLDGAAARGLHHLRLTPRSVIVCRDGTVKISGTAVEAAAAGLEPDHAATAGRVDAIALIGLLYSGLTGRWPLGDAGFPPAPRGENGGPVPPADLVRGVPNDLDTLCVVTLGPHNDGPRTPAELVRELAPWPSSAEAPLRAANRRPAEGSTARPSADDQPLAVRRPGAGRLGQPQPPRPQGRSAGLFTTPSVAATGPQPVTGPTAAGPSRMDSLFTQHTVYPDQPPAGPPGAAPPPGGPPPAGPRPAGGRPAGQQRPTGERPAGQRPSGERPPADRPAGQRPARQRPAGPAPAGPGPAPAGFPPAAAASAPPTRPAPLAPGRAARPAPDTEPMAAQRSAWSRPAGPRPDPAAGNHRGGSPARDPHPARAGRPKGNLPAGPSGSQTLFPGWSNGTGPAAGPETTGPFPIVIPAEPAAAGSPAW